MISYTDSEVSVFHPICERALNNALSNLGLSGTYQVVHHRHTGTLEMDYVIGNITSGKYLCVIEVKRTPADVNSARYQFQAMSYVQSNTGISEKPFYILTNLECAYAFRYDSSRPRVFQQMLQPGLMQISDFSSDNEADVENKLTTYFENCICSFVADTYNYLLTLEEFVIHMEPLKNNSREWKSHLAILLYEYIRGSFTYLHRTDLRDVRLFGNNISRICAEASRVNFKGIYDYNVTRYVPTVTVPNSELVDLFDLGQQNVTGDTIAGVLHTIVSSGHEHDGEVATDLELGRLVAALAKDELGTINSTDCVCDPAAGSGNLISSAIEILALNPTQIIANDVNSKLLELLSLRLGLNYASSICTTNSPTITNYDITSLSQAYFSDVKLLLMNPPYLAGINCGTRKNPFYNAIRNITGNMPMTEIGQMPLEGAFLELVTELVVPDTVIACVFPSNFLTARGEEAITLRNLLLSKFGLRTIFTYPGNDIFDGVTKGTCVLVGRAKQPAMNVKILTSYSNIPDIDIHQFLGSLSCTLHNTFTPIMAGVEGKQISVVDLQNDLTDGWRSLNREMEEALNFVKNNFELSPDFVQLNTLTIPMKRGTAGNGGGSDLLFIDKNPTIYNKYLPLGLSVGPAIRNSKYDNFVVGAGDACFLDERMNNGTMITNIINDYMATLSNGGRQQRNAKTFAQWQDIVRKESRKSFPANSVLVPRGIRATGRAYYSATDIYVSTNFLVCSFGNTRDAVLASTWMATIFYQIMCEISSKNEEGMRKMEVQDIKKTFVPIFSNVSTTTYNDLNAIIATIEFVDLHNPQIRNVDEIWARELFGTNANIMLNDAQRILAYLADIRDKG